MYRSTPFGTPSVSECQRYLNLYTITVHTVWDEAAHVWTATSDDLPDLGDGSRIAGQTRGGVKLLVPQLLALQKHTATDDMSPAPFYRLVANVPASAVT